MLINGDGGPPQEHGTERYCNANRYSSHTE